MAPYININDDYRPDLVQETQVSNNTLDEGVRFVSYVSVNVEH